MRLNNLFLLIMICFSAIIISCNNDAGNGNDGETDKDSLAEQKKEVEIGELSINILDEAANNLIDVGTEIEVLATGFSWSEGPVWVDDINALLFSDVPENKIYKWSEEDSLSVYLDKAGFTGEGKGDGTNGLMLDTEGDLLVCQHGDRRVAIMNATLAEPKNEFITVADKFDNKQFNSPNDLDLDSLGNLYFTDPPYGLKDQQVGEIGKIGVYKVSTAGEVVLLVDSLVRPNGIALSLDEKTLYVNNSDPENPVMYSYNFDEKGKLVNGKVFFDAAELQKAGGKGLPDGLKIHKTGNIFATGPGGVLIISPEGKHLATINTSKATANCCFDTNQEYLYMTAHDALMRVKLK